MTDRLLQLSQNATARKVVTTLGLPVPLPPHLERSKGPWEERPLHDRTVVVGLGAGAELADVLAHTLARAGANPHVHGGDLAPFTAAGEAYGRMPVSLSGDDSPKKPWAFVFDGTGLKTIEDLKGLYTHLHPRIRGIGKSGRVVILGRPHDSFKGAERAAVQRALEGFTRSLAKEVGRKGATAQYVSVAKGAEDRVEPALRWLLSPRSAYVTGQPVRLSKSVRTTDMPSTRPLDGKVALVTGAARGIGAATARTLAREGATVIILDRPDDDAPAAAIASELGGHIFLADVTDAETPARLAAYITENFGELDIVVHNAGVTRDKTLANMREPWWDLTLDVNLGAILRLHDALEPVLASHARIVLLSSIAGIAGNVGQTNYAATKAGVIGIVETLGPKLAKRGIAVNAVAPGFIETRMTDAIPVATREVARRLCNLSQGGLPQDVAETITFLSSPGAAGLCGQVLRVCGGSLVGA